MVICLWAVSLSCLNMANAAAEDVQPFLRVVGAVRAALRQHPRVAGASSGILHWCCWERLRLQSPTRSYLTCLQLIRRWFFVLGTSWKKLCSEDVSQSPGIAVVEEGARSHPLLEADHGVLYQF